MTEPIIQLKNVSVEFNSKKKQVSAVNNVNLTINKGDIFGIVGYSGAGKSTLVRLINLLQKPTSGQVIVNKQNLLELSDKELRISRKKIGMIFQHFNLMNARTIFNNVAFALKGTDLSKKQKNDRVNELLDLVGLSDKANNYPSELSGGQKQRVGIARAIANHPDILISDEATSALDPKTTQSILELLDQINKKLGLTIVLITHQMEAIKQISHHVAVMDQGKIIEEGSVYQIFSEPQKSLTKSFINTTTRLDETLKVLYEQENVKHLSKDQKLLSLSYFGDSTDEPLISSLYEKFQVSANILYGNIEMLQGQPLGNLVVILSGTEQSVQNALNYLNESRVKVTELNPSEGDINELN
ncbi:methionine import ATP-binding protein MetN [Xylocopilactobacillus apis]|uniref:Methionine import ATP-binding protein MetN n=1 Tax=Xylocopilactobacillus apis TaxID=2932183 RepID=A0AAU9DDY1_9LACO|nr:methionine import ATP-binding protein MetN [Xylocopilactobacillus apis]